MITLPEFTEALDSLGIDYYEAGQSLVIKDCPACGSSDYKVLLRVTEENNNLFFGRCLHGRCLQNYSSLSYLIKSGAERTYALSVHNMDISKTLERLANPLPELLLDSKKEETVKEITYIKDSFMYIEDWNDHPASVYAKKRGYVSEFRDIIRINPDNGSVVFLVKDEKGIVGYQERFVFPKNPKMKAKTSDGFSKSERVLIFGQEKDREYLICEGPFTALSAWHYGYIGICTFGSSFSDSQFNTIVDIAGDKNIGVAVETTESGTDHANKIMVDKLSRRLHWIGKRVFLVQGATPGDLNDSWQNGSDIIVGDPIDIDPAIPTLLPL